MMNRKPKFLIVLAIAAITFGGLMKIIELQHFNRHNCSQRMEHCEKEKVITEKTIAVENSKK